MIGRRKREAPQLSFLCTEQQQHLHGTTHSTLIQMKRAIEELKRDLKELHSSSLTLVRGFQQQWEDCLYQIMATVHGLQLQKEALQTFQARAVALEQCLQEVSERYKNEKQKRKMLHNNLVELKGNIRVHCRIRPLLPSDTPSDDSTSRERIHLEEVVHAPDDEKVLVRWNRPGHASVDKMFQFERVYSQGESQKAIFVDVCPLLTSLLDGYNVCIMAYGQTGSGKSYTMLGAQSQDDPALLLETEHSVGIIPRVAKELFRLISETPSQSHWVEVSIVEVYNNEIWDLLAKDSSGTVLGVKREVITTKDGKSSPPAPCLSEAPEKLKRVQTKLQLVDLAGSECVGTSGVTGAALRETSFINRSLSALADVLGALSKQQAHVPYRNSRLTHLLQDSIGGEAKLLVMLCVSPSPRALAETVQSLGFGSRARQVQRGRAKRRSGPVAGTPK